ncbi:MAG: alcohol dehydrogenase catalytic domain-containing protein [Acidobacteriaceae bacterium]|nr:alcohol dehydrogenase catalytic domain-containing protein [Acidobacteriaceae bacterium]
MLAVHLQSGQVSVIQADVPHRPPGYALVRMQLAGICNTDIELVRGYYGFSGIPGHEFVGEVVAAQTASLIGTRVVGEINLACGDCDFCHIQLPRHCLRRKVLGIVQHPGAFAEYVTLPEQNLHVVPAGLSNEEAVFVEPLAAACEILDQVGIPEGAHVAVLGDGKLGLLIAQVLHVHGARVVLYGRHEHKLQIARKAGISTSLSEEKPTALYPFVVESTGSADGLRESVKLVRPRGTIVMKSTVHGQVSLDTAHVIVNEISLVGSRCGRFSPALALLEAKKIDVLSLLAAEFPLPQAAEGFMAAQQPGALKVLLRNDQNTRTS